MNLHDDKSTLKHFLDSLRHLPALDTIGTHTDGERTQVVEGKQRAHKALSFEPSKNIHEKRQDEAGEGKIFSRKQIIHQKSCVGTVNMAKKLRFSKLHTPC